MVLLDIFKSFDEIRERHKLKRLESTLTSYIVVAGLSNQGIPNHAELLTQFVLECRDKLNEMVSIHRQGFSMRVGVHSSPLKTNKMQRGNTTQFQLKTCQSVIGATNMAMYVKYVELC